MGVAKNRGTPKSSILMGFSLINHPFWGTTIFGNTKISRVLVNLAISTSSRAFGPYTIAINDRYTWPKINRVNGGYKL